MIKQDWDLIQSRVDSSVFLLSENVSQVFEEFRLKQKKKNTEFPFTVRYNRSPRPHIHTTITNSQSLESTLLGFVFDCQIPIPFNNFYLINSENSSSVLETLSVSWFQPPSRQFLLLVLVLHLYLYGDRYDDLYFWCRTYHFFSFRLGHNSFERTTIVTPEAQRSLTRS